MRVLISLPHMGCRTTRRLLSNGERKNATAAWEVSEVRELSREGTEKGRPEAAFFP
jgi:hypothetical protein